MGYTEQADINILAYSDYGVNDDVENLDLNDMLDAFTALSDNIVDILGADASPTRDISEIESDLATAESDIDTLQASIATGIKVCTANYTILDDDGYGIIVIDPRTGAKTITLPTLADNQSRTIKFIVSHRGGDVTIDGEGAETISGMAFVVLGGQYDEINIVGTASEWLITSGKATHSTGWINTADWTDRHLGDMSITYNNLVGAFTVGEVVTEADTGNTWVITADTGAVLTCKYATGTGHATNAKGLTGGTSGATATVNGATKNADGNVNHRFGVNLSSGITVDIYISSDGTENNCNRLATYIYDTANDRGVQVMQVSSNAIKVQTGVGGCDIMDDAGSTTIYDSEDHYYKVVASMRW